MTGTIKVEPFDADTTDQIDAGKLTLCLLPANIAISLLPMGLLSTATIPHALTNGAQFSILLSRLAESFTSYFLKFKSKKITIGFTSRLIVYGLSPTLGESR